MLGFAAELPLRAVGLGVQLVPPPCPTLPEASGYFRVLPPQWRDRLEKLKALGCNSAEVRTRVWGLGFGVWGLGFGVWGLIRV